MKTILLILAAGNLAVLLVIASMGMRMAPTLLEDVHGILTQGHTAAWNLSATFYHADQLVQRVNDPKAGLPHVLDSLNGHVKHKEGEHGLADVLYNIDAMTATSRGTSNSVRLAAMDEHAALVGGEDSQGVVRIGVMPAVQQLIEGTAANLNGAGVDANGNHRGLLPAMTEQIDGLGKIEVGMVGDNGPLVAATAMLKQGSAILADPDLKRFLKSLAAAGDQGAEAMKHVNGATAHVEKATGYIEDDLSPHKIGFWKSLAIGVAGHVLPPVAGALVTHWEPMRVDTRITQPITVQPAKQ